MMKKIFIAFGHHNTTTSFNAAIRDTFIDEVKKCGHEIDLINLYDKSSELEKSPAYASPKATIIAPVNVAKLINVHVPPLRCLYIRQIAW